MSDPKLIIRSAWRPKDGHRPDEYEDAFAVSPPRPPFRAAVADGATESVYSGGWARALVETFVTAGEANPGAGASDAHSDSRAHPGPAALSNSGARSTASPLADAILQAGTSWAPEPDPRWYVAAKAAEGAHAALLGFELRRDGWLAEAVGDCCLFHFRDDLLRTAWPIDDPDAFSNRPPLVSSRSEATPADAIQTTAGQWTPGDDFLLASDAIAQWIVAGAQGSKNLFRGHSHGSSLNDLVDEARRGGMRNDDVTLVQITIQP